jgi:excisionase family DNA binding protein
MKSIEDAIRDITASMPAGSSVTLPIEWLRNILDGTPMSTEVTTTVPAIDYTVGQVAALIGRKSSTVRGWCSAGLITAYRLNNRDWRISQEALQDFQRVQREQKNLRHARQGRRRNRVPVDLGAWRNVTTNK